MPHELNCVFCAPHADRIFYEGERVRGLWDAFPVSPGHALLIPRRHVATWFEASVEEQRDLASAISVAQRAVVERHEPDGFNIGINVGEAGGQTVAHLHVHVIPRYRGDVEDPRGGVRGVIPARRLYGAEGDLASIAADQPGQYAAGMIAPAPPHDPTSRTAEAAAFSERIIQLLDQGRFTATYKFAVLLGLMDVCLQHTSAGGAAPSSVSTRDLAERVLELYWPHTVPFSAEKGDVGRVLAQNNNGQAEIVSTIARFRERFARDRSVPLGAARRVAPDRYERLIDRIEWKLIEMPLQRLQVVGEGQTEFLYRVGAGWGDDARRRDIEAGLVDRRIHFVDGAGEHLVQLAGVLRPLIERQWVSMVAGYNRDITGELVLQEFLFGADRVSLEPGPQPSSPAAE